MTVNSRFWDLLAVALVATILLFVLTPSADAVPRELSEAEREAVTLAVAYFDQGPEAWWPRLTDDSPLRRLGQDAAIAALEVRAGPTEGALWQLRTVPEAAGNTAVFAIEFPSGMEETLLMRLRETTDGWRIDSVRMSGEPPRGFQSPASAQAAMTEAPIEPVPEQGRERGRLLPSILGGLAVLMMILAIRRGIAFAIAGLGAGAVALAVLLWPRTLEQPPSETRVKADPEAEIAQLLDLRRALATADAETLEAAAIPTEGPASQVARLWHAQRALFSLDLNAVDAALRDFPASPAIPQAVHLRAHLGLLRRSEVDTALAYERLLDIGTWNDALLFEAAQAFGTLGFPARAERYFQELEDLGTREADVYFTLASTSLVDGNTAGAERYFREAWRLKPRTRDAVMGHTFLAYLVEETAALKELLALDSPNDAPGSCLATSSQPLSLPEGASARLLGAFLSLEIGEGEIEIPGGCALAPNDVDVMDAGSWRERRENLMLTRLPRLLAAVRSPTGLAQPSVRKRTASTVEALARRGRWDDVLTLTEDLETNIAGIPAQVIRHRSEALRRAGRRQAARDVLTALATSNIQNRQVDPLTLYQLAELLVTEGEYDRALKLMAKAHTQLPFEMDPRRIRQVQLEKRLANASAVYESEHFEVLYPYQRSLYFAERVAEILEAERRRLKRWIPISSSAKTQVYLLEFDEFQANYGGNVDIMGLFDGKIRVPFAEVNTFVPFIVSVLTHELAHAMITEATNDRAPRWFQEGLAQHVEMPQEINPIAGYQSTGNLLSFPLIETVLRSFAAPRFVPVAYDESRWVLHFIENRYGVRGIHRLLEAFREGLTTEDALAQVTGLSIPEFDREVWDWCLNRAPEIWPTQIVHYDTYDSPVMVPEVYEEEGDEEEGGEPDS